MDAKRMSALDTQVGGNHYRDCAIQPVEYIMANGLDFCQGAVIKYVHRFRDKGGIKDLEKAKHFIDLLIDFERMKCNEKKPPMVYPKVNHCECGTVNCACGPLCVVDGEACGIRPDRRCPNCPVGKP